MSPYYYEQLLKTGVVSLRYGHSGSKVEVINLPNLNVEERRKEESYVENLNFYRENRERLPSEFG